MDVPLMWERDWTGGLLEDLSILLEETLYPWRVALAGFDGDGDGAVFWENGVLPELLEGFAGGQDRDGLAFQGEAVKAFWFLGGANAGFGADAPWLGVLQGGLASAFADWRDLAGRLESESGGGGLGGGKSRFWAERGGNHAARMDSGIGFAYSPGMAAGATALAGRPGGRTAESREVLAAAGQDAAMDFGTGSAEWRGGLAAGFGVGNRRVMTGDNRETGLEAYHGGNAGFLDWQQVGSVGANAENGGVSREDAEALSWRLAEVLEERLSVGANRC